MLCSCFCSGLLELTRRQSSWPSVRKQSAQALSLRGAADRMRMSRTLSRIDRARAIYEASAAPVDFKSNRSSPPPVESPARPRQGLRD
eukprot:9494281-Pyramimonas_sp.AAC.1